MNLVIYKPAMVPLGERPLLHYLIFQIFTVLTRNSMQCSVMIHATDEAQSRPKYLFMFVCDSYRRVRESGLMVGRCHRYWFGRILFDTCVCQVSQYRVARNTLSLMILQTAVEKQIFVYRTVLVNNAAPPFILDQF